MQHLLNQPDPTHNPFHLPADQTPTHNPFLVCCNALPELRLLLLEGRQVIYVFLSAFEILLEVCTSGGGGRGANFGMGSMLHGGI